MTPMPLTLVLVPWQLPEVQVLLPATLFSKPAAVPQLLLPSLLHFP